MMNMNCERPYAFYFLLLLIPSIAVTVFQHRRIVKKMSFFSVVNENDSQPQRMAHFPMLMAARTFLRCLSWTMLVFAYSGISWGTYLEPVGKTGSSVAMVFDISYSMMAKDAQGGQTRLKSSAEYASMLLSHIPDASVSVVLAKGDGVTVVPLTEDKSFVESLLDSLSPALMSVGGTSLGRGLRAALKTFPEKSARLSTVWIFTDGEETDGLLEGSISDSLKSGVSVCIVGFGGEKETSVLAGDGRTSVYTALRSDNMKRTCAAAMSKSYSGEKIPVRASFVNSAESGSALKVLSFLKGEKQNPSADDSTFVTYEARPVQRYGLFLGLCVMFLVLSFVVTELDAAGISDRIYRRHGRMKASRKALSALSVFACLSLSSCSSRFEGSRKILESTWNWYQRKYSGATAGFFQTLSDAREDGDFVLEQYALYNLGTTYLMQNEHEAAVDRFAQVSEDAPDHVRFSAFYNTGIIAYRHGDYDSAIQCFRSALKIDGSKTNAKVNLELASVKSQKDSKSRENAITPVGEAEKSGTMERAVFSRIRENDMKQWKSSERREQSSGSGDF